MLSIQEVLSDVASSPCFCKTKEVEVNSRGLNGETPLHWMATLGDDVATRLLIEAGANINTTNNEGNTPLHEAIISRQVIVARTLITCGANLSHQNKAGLSSFDLAQADGYNPIIELFNSVNL